MTWNVYFKWGIKALPKHHIIPKYEWFERFGNMKGVNAQDNTCNLTLSQHAEAHMLLYELNHNDRDLEAHQACVGTILKRMKLKEKAHLHTTRKKRKKFHRSHRKWHIWWIPTISKPSAVHARLLSLCNKTGRSMDSQPVGCACMIMHSRKPLSLAHIKFHDHGNSLGVSRRS